MPLIIVEHEVKNYVTWRSHFDADLARREAIGYRNEHIYQDATNSNYVYFIAEIDDTLPVKIRFNDPAIRKAMKDAGVVSDPKLTLLNET